MAAREVFSGRADRLSIASLAALCILAVAVFRDYGISNDEEVQHRYGELIVDYYVSGFRDVSLFNYKNLYLYGGLFDVVAVLLAKILPFDAYLIRHLLSALIGVGGIAAAFATARLIAGPRAGLIALVALAICGPYFGGMFNHTKDVPFAAAMMGAVYFLLRAGRDLPSPRWPHLIGFGLLFGAATGLRAMGLLLIGYALVLVAMSTFASTVRSQGTGAMVRFAATGALRFAPAILLGYAIMLAAWPWAALAPLNPLRAIFSFAHFHYEIRTIVAGEIYKMADVPWWYVPFYLSIKTPTLVLAGAILSMGFLIRAMAREGPGSSPGDGPKPRLWLSSRSSLSCARRLRKARPLPGCGISCLWCRRSRCLRAWASMRRSRRFQRVVSWKRRPRALLAAAFALQRERARASASLRILFYNPLVGGLEGAQRRYEMDYWVNMMPDAVQALQEYLGLAEGQVTARLYGRGLRREVFVRQLCRQAAAGIHGLAGIRFLHRPDPHELRPPGRRPRGQDDPAHGGADRGREGSPRHHAEGAGAGVLTCRAHPKQPAGEDRRALDPRRARGHTRCGSPGRLGRAGLGGFRGLQNAVRAPVVGGAVKARSGAIDGETIFGPSPRRGR